MVLRLALAWLHLLALGIGLGAVYTRARSLSERPLITSAVRRAFVADTWWGVAAILWIGTGLWRLLGNTEKGTSYYLHNHVFFLKMGLFIFVLTLEVWPMISLIRWRKLGSGEGWQPDEATASRIVKISYLELGLIIGIVLAAVTMARGFGYN